MQENIDIYLQQLPALAIPPANLSIRPASAGGKYKLEVYDFLRKKWLGLSPEEWVRQNFVHFLVSERNFPSEMMANEIGLKFNGTLRRCDTVVFSRTLRPLAIVEYKAPSVKLTQEVFNQILRYNSVMDAPLLIVSNGLKNFCCLRSKNTYRFLPDIPDYRQIVAIENLNG